MVVSANSRDVFKTERAIVHVIDDDISVRESLNLLLTTVDLRVRTYTSVKEFLDVGCYKAPGCIVLDVRLPGISGLDFQARSERYGVYLPMILTTGHSDVPMTVRAMKAGAVDFLPKPFRDQDIIDAVSTAIERDRKRRDAALASASACARYASMSPREQQVMNLISAGRMNKQVAFEMGLSVVTVKSYRGAVMRKMAADTFADLVRMADLVSTYNSEALLSHRLAFGSGEQTDSAAREAERSVPTR
jgi:FixJ family two-component response regulator